MAVKVQFEIGHSSKLRSKKTVEGFTHDWELYVKGSQQADISTFVEKIIYNLHESFPKPKRVCKEPPYVIQESGYAGFLVFIEIYFRNRDEPKKVQYTYDLDLQTTGPPQHRCEVRKFIFENPTDEFRQKLLRGGGVPVSGVLGSNAIANSAGPGVSGAVPAPHPEMHKSSTTEKKHKSRPDDSKLNSFANLFGPPITKTAGGTVGIPAVGVGAGVVPSSNTSAGNSKHSPDTKAQQMANVGNNLPPPKEKSSKDKEKSSSEKSKERSERKEKHHRQTGASPHKEGRSDSKKSESKHEKRDKNEERSKKDKNRDKDRDRDRDKTSSSSATNVSTSNNKKPSSPKLSRELSPHKTASVAGGASSTASATSVLNNSNAVGRPSSSQGGKLDEVKSSSKSSKDSSSKDSKQKESSSSSSGKKSKKEKKDKDKDKERDKERRHEEREKQKLLEATSKAAAASKDELKSSLPPNKVNSNSSAPVHTSGESKQSTNSLNASSQQEILKKSEKSSKQESTKFTDKVVGTSATQPSAMATVAPPSVPTPATTDKKSSNTGSSSSAPPEKDKRSHKHKKKEKNKDKDKERERDKDRDKDKDKDREKDKDKESKKEKDLKEKIIEEKNSENFSAPPPLQQALTANLINSPRVSNPEESPGINTTPSSSTSSTTTSSSSKSSKNKEKKSKDKSSKEDKIKHKSNDLDASETKTKQVKLSSSSSLSTTTTPTIIAPVNPPIPHPVTSSTTIIAASSTTHLDLSDNDSISSTPLEPPITSTTTLTTTSNQTNSNTSKPPPPIITHSDSSNSSFPDLSIPKAQKPTSQELAKPVNPTPPPLKEPPPKSSKSSKDKNSTDKSSKDEEKEKKRRRNSQAANTFIEPPLKQMKKESKSVREKSKSPSLRNTGTRASISEATSTFLQPGASPSSSTAAAPLPPPSLAVSAAHSPALSATEAVGNAISATANAATCNSNSTTPTSTTNSLASHQLPLDYLSELQELHHKIMTLQDNEDLQHVVEMIAATGCYEITTKTFDFDLCKLDRVTVQRLQEFFATSVS